MGNETAELTLRSAVGPYALLELDPDELDPELPELEEELDELFAALDSFALEELDEASEPLESEPFESEPLELLEPLASEEPLPEPLESERESLR